MVTRVHSYSKRQHYGQSVPEGQVLEIGGRQELVVKVGINGIQYQDWITIEQYDGSIDLLGNHVHELISAVLRFSSKRMRDSYRSLLDMTDIITESKPYQQESFDSFQIECEKLKRENEEEFNEKQERNIGDWRMRMWEREKEND